MPTTSYGTWGTYTGVSSISETVNDFISRGGDEWIGQLVQTGAWDGIVDDFRAAINAKLPGGVTLHGDYFCGPYPLNEGVRPAELNESIRAVIDAVDLGAIVAKYDSDADTPAPAPAPVRRESEENYDDVYGLTFPGRYPGAGDVR